MKKNITSNREGYVALADVCYKTTTKSDALILNFKKIQQTSLLSHVHTLEYETTSIKNCIVVRSLYHGDFRF